METSGEEIYASKSIKVSGYHIGKKMGGDRKVDISVPLSLNQLPCSVLIATRVPLHLPSYTHPILPLPITRPNFNSRNDISHADFLEELMATLRLLVYLSLFLGE